MPERVVYSRASPIFEIRVLPTFRGVPNFECIEPTPPVFETRERSARHDSCRDFYESHFCRYQCRDANRPEISGQTAG